MSECRMRQGGSRAPSSSSLLEALGADGGDTSGAVRMAACTQLTTQVE